MLTTVRHLFQIDIAAIGDIQLFLLIVTSFTYSSQMFLPVPNPRHIHSLSARKFHRVRCRLAAEPHSQALHSAHGRRFFQLSDVLFVLLHLQGEATQYSPKDAKVSACDNS